MAEETLADLFLAAGVREQRRPRPLSMRPAWQRTPEANTPYRAPQQALADRNTVPYLRQETRNERRQQNDLAQFALEHEAARNEVNTPPGTYLGQDALEMTGLPSVARGIGHLRDGEPGQALPEVALGGLGVLGMVAGGGARTPRARPPMRAALPEIPAEAPRLPNAPARLPGRATDGSVLPIRPPQPIRQSMVGGSDDLAEAAAMRPQVQGDPEALSLARSWIDTFGGGPDAEARAIAVMKQHAREATHPLRRQLLEEAVASVRSRQYVRGEPNTFSARVEEAWPEIYGSRSGPDAGPVQGENDAIRVYHGSPHSFDQFSLDHFGTGEGNARFGYGVYVAENPGVGRSYQANLAPHERLAGGEAFDASDPQHVAADALSQANGRRGEAVAALWREIHQQGGSRTPRGRILTRAAAAINDHREFNGPMPALSERRGASYLYEADLNVSPSEVLDLDLPWSQQPAQVRERLGQYMPQGATHMDDLYQSMIDELGSPKAAAEILRQRGFRALAYLDQGSREAGAGTRNYVVFDESALAARSRNGEQISPRTAPDGRPVQAERTSPASVSGAGQPIRRGASGYPFVDQFFPVDDAAFDQFRAQFRPLRDAGDFTESEVPLDRLTGTNKFLSRDFENAASLVDARDGQLPWVYQAPDGRMLIMDGHNRLSAAVARGETSARVRVYRSPDAPVRSGPSGSAPKRPRPRPPMRPTQ